MPDIKQLPPSVINKIAAGEVIERPASVVKELLENAVDAGSSRVDVSIEQGGGQLVRVSDNGHGIRPDQLLLAVASHATSKIYEADDLFHVRSLGFRGEALASIAEVSQFRIRSREVSSDAGAELEVAGGRIGNVAPCGCAVGTTVEVRNLFHNTPVRRKFLRTTQTEMGHVAEAFTRIALAFPAVHFSLRHNDRTIHDLPPVDRWRDRIAALFGNALCENLIHVESNDELLQLSGYAADPNVSRGNNRMQYLFLNGRHIRDRSLQHALSEAYRGLLLTGRYPVAFLRLELPPEQVDVNVHPTKLEVRFQDGSRLYSQLLGTLRNKFLTTDLTARVAPTGSAAAETPFRPFPDQAGLSGLSGVFRPSSDSGSSAPAGQLRLDRGDGGWTNNVPPPSEPTEFRRETWESAAGSEIHWDNRQTMSGGSMPGPAAASMPGRSSLGMQLHNRYLVTENEAGIVVIDQHALHERVLYEQLRGKVLDGKLETQRLLVPEPVTMTAAEAAAALDAAELLAQLGIDIEPFGGDTVLVTGYPAMLANLGPAELLRQVVEQLMAGGRLPDRRDLLDELLHMISCKAAVKAGDHLSAEEVTVLLEQRHLCQDAHHCPHGRPTALVFTREELDKRFKRI